MAGKLTTHVLDTMNGRPAAGLALTLARLDGDTRVALMDVVTNADGRVDGPLLEGSGFAAGVYEITFDVGAYFGARARAGDAQFLGTVPVRFTVTDTDAHYHVPLLVSPYAYSTYRGS